MNFDNKVVLITGASRGLGRTFAHAIGAAGARVALNSTGTNPYGEETAEQVRQAGGDAFHIVGSVEDATTLVDTTVDHFGRIDGIVHNAGFVQDKTLRKMTAEQWDSVLDVHLKASFQLTQAAWPHFEEQNGGRLVFLSSSAGLYGNFGQANYAAAKMGMYGLCRTIAIEGHRANIRCNCVAPFGATQLNSANMSAAMKSLVKAEFVAPLIAYLAHPDCLETGSMFEASAGVFKKVRWERNEGLALDPDRPMTIDDIAAGWEQVVDFRVTEHPNDMREALSGMYERRALE